MLARNIALLTGDKREILLVCLPKAVYEFSNPITNDVSVARNAQMINMDLCTFVNSDLYIASIHLIAGALPSLYFPCFSLQKSEENCFKLYAAIFGVFAPAQWILHYCSLIAPHARKGSISQARMLDSETKVKQATGKDTCRRSAYTWNVRVSNSSRNGSRLFIEASAWVTYSVCPDCMPLSSLMPLVALLKCEITSRRVARHAFLKMHTFRSRGEVLTEVRCEGEGFHSSPPFFNASVDVLSRCKLQAFATPTKKPYVVIGQLHLGRSLLACSNIPRWHGFPYFNLDI